VDDFDDIFRLRRLLEGAAAERSARSFTPESLTALHELAVDFRSAMNRDGASILVPEFHRNLHLALLPGASPWERQLLLQIWDASERYGQLYVKHEINHQHIDQIIEDHDVLVEAAGTTAPRAFRKAIVSHVDGCIAALRPLILEVIGGRATRAPR
jgi:DNA-binding GntR family transcriptional regulator